MVLGNSSNPRSEAAPSGAAGQRMSDRVRFHALGTQCEIQYATDDRAAGQTFVREAVAWVHAFEAKYSRFRPDSLIGRINAAAGRDWVVVDSDAERIFAQADQIHVLTRGIIDPTMLPLLRLWNYRAAAPRVPAVEEITAAVAKTGWARVRREPGRIYLPEAGMGLDLGGFGKEYAVDRVLDFARVHSVANVLVDFGHDVRVLGAPPGAPCWAVGVEDSRMPGTVRSRLAVSDAGIATSGDYVRFFEAGGRRFGHIIDPRSGYPVSNECRAVTVVANTCLEAGLLSTTAFVLGPTDGLRLIEDYFGAEGSIATERDERQTRGFCKFVY